MFYHAPEYFNWAPPKPTGGETPGISSYHGLKPVATVADIGVSKKGADPDIGVSKNLEKPDIGVSKNVLTTVSDYSIFVYRIY